MYKFINLQMFADANVQVTTAASVGNDLSPTMKTYYDTELLENARENLYFNQFGQKQPLPAGKGNIVEWRKWSSFSKALTPLVEGVTPDGNKLNMTKLNATVSQSGDYTTISDRLELEAIDDTVLAATDEHGAQAGLTIDTITRNELVSGKQVIYAPTVSGTTETAVTSRIALDATAKLTPSVVSKAATQLKKMKAPMINGSWIGIIHPSVTEDLRASDAWIEAHKYAAVKEIFNGEIGELHGVRFVESTEAKVLCGADLASDSRTLTVNGAVAVADDEVTFDGGTVAISALVGRYVLIGGVKYYVSANTATVLTLKDAVVHTTAASLTVLDGVSIYPGEGGAAGVAVYACLFLGKDAYGVVDPAGAGMEMIVKQKGSAGTSDPLNQRSTVGWKCNHAAKILYQERICRVECGSSYSGVDEEN